MHPTAAEAAPALATPAHSDAGTNAAAGGSAQTVQALASVAVIVAEIDPIALSRTVVEEAARLLDAERATLFLLNAAGSHLETLPSPGQGESRGMRRLPRGQGLAWAALDAGRQINVPQAYADLRFDPESDRLFGTFTRSVLAAPILGTSGPLGVLEVANRRAGPFDGDDELCLRALCAAVAAALENAKRFAELQNMRRYSDGVLQSMSNGVITLDGQSRIITCNAAALRLIRRRRDDILGVAAERVFHGINAWVLERSQRVAATGVAYVSKDAELRFGRQRLIVNVTVLPLVDCQTNAIGTMVLLEDTTAEKQVKAMLSRYMDPRLAGQLLERGGDALGGRSVLATLLFCDLRNSTELAEELGAQGTVALLNEYFTLIDDCLREEGGMLDKFIGDAVMAAFGIPFSGDDDEDRAVRAALAMTAALRRWNEARAASGLAAVEMGVGINTDIVVAGNIGSPRRMDYTLIGAGVNLAARLEKACKQFATPILISERTARRLKGRYPIRPVGTLERAGAVDPVAVYEVIDDHAARSFTDLQAALVEFARGVDFRQRGRLEDAAACFRTCLSHNPSDRAAAVQLDACRPFPLAVGS